MTAANRFIPLEPPQKSEALYGWYVASLELADPIRDQYYYLHDSGIVHDYCGDGPNGSTGWFPNADAAFDAGRVYYNKHGIVYPYALCSDGNFYNLDGTLVGGDSEKLSETIESQEMIF